jgi:hypothetical protein
MKLHAATMSGVKVDFEVDSGAVTIEEVKRKIFAQSDSIPVEAMGLIIAGGKRPGNSATLDELGIKEGATFHVVRSLKSMASLETTHEELQREKAAANQQAPAPAATREGGRATSNSTTTSTTTSLPQLQQQQPQQQPQLTSVVVPAGVSPGQLLQVRTVDGRMMRVAVPAGHYPGMTFQFQVPAPPVPQPQQQQRLLVTCPGTASAGQVMPVRACMHACMHEGVAWRCHRARQGRRARLDRC